MFGGRYAVPQQPQPQQQPGYPPPGWGQAPSTAGGAPDYRMVATKPQGNPQPVNSLTPPETGNGGTEDEKRRRQMLIDALKGNASQDGWGKLGKGLGDIFGTWMKSRQGPAPGPGPAPADLPPPSMGSVSSGLY